MVALTHAVQISVGRILLLIRMSIFSLFFIVSFYNVAVAAPELKTSDADITRIEALFKKIGQVESEAKRDELEKLFRARSAAHRLRLSQVFLKISKDKEFLKHFPEFAPLIHNSKKTVTALLEHDASKADAATAKAIRVLSMSQGLNYRNPPPGVSAEDKDLIVRTMKNAIDDLNTIDDDAMTNVLKKVSPNQAWTKSHDALTETIDFYDTFKSRQAELAKDGKPLVSPSEWIKKLEGEGFYSSEEKKENILKKRFAKYLETTDPLANSKTFAKAEDFAHLTNSANFTEDLEKTFASKGNDLVRQATKMQAMQRLSRFANVAKGVPMSYAIMAGIDYVASPETANATDMLANFTMSTETSNCDTNECHQFIKDCKSTLKIKTIALTELIARDDFSKCLAEFFNLPLEVQTKRRRADVNLDRLLARFSPNVDTLQCSADGLSVQTYLKNNDSTSLSTKIIFSSKGDTNQIVGTTADQKKQNRLIFSNSEAQVFQNCSTLTSCENYEIKDMLEIKLGIWRSDKLPRIASGPLRQVDIDSFLWARKAHQLAANQTDSIKKCCSESSCQRFFSDENPQSKAERQLAVKVQR